MVAHIHEKIDSTVSIYIVHENKVLLHKHKLLNIWLPPGGHIELDEDPNEAAIREAKEESGLDVQLVGKGRTYDSAYDARDLIPPRFLNRHFFDATHTHEHVDLCFFARSQSSKVRHEVEGMDIRWFSKDELKAGAEVIADVRMHALAALEELSE